MIDLEIRINGAICTASLPPQTTLLGALRETWGLTGAKIGCDVGDCGACTVLLDGEPINACLVLAAQAHGREVETVEGLADRDGLHPIQAAFEKHAALQCGFCGPGVIMSAKALLDANPEPTVHEVRDALSGNLCRCTGYAKLVNAIMDVAGSGGAEQGT